LNYSPSAAPGSRPPSVGDWDRSLSQKPRSARRRG